MAARGQFVNVGSIVDPGANLTKSFSSLSDVLFKYGDKQKANQDRGFELQDERVALEKKADIRNTVKGVKSDLDQALDTRTNAAYAGLQDLDAQYKADEVALNKEYQKANNLYSSVSEKNNAEYNDAEGNSTTKYDAAGNPKAFADSTEGLAYQQKQGAFDQKYAAYKGQLAQQLDTLNKTTLATYEADYNANNIQENVYNKLIDKGLNLEEALTASQSAAKPYQQAPLSDRQKIALEAKLKNNETLTTAELKHAEELFKDTRKYTNVGSNVDSNGNVVNKTAAKTYGANETKDAQNLIMDQVTNVNAFGNDNKQVIEKFLNPSIREFAGQLTPQDIADELLTYKDDGTFINTIDSDLTKAKFTEGLQRRVDARKRAAVVGNQVLQSGNARISQEDYNKQVKAIEARAANRNATTQAQFQGAGDRETGLTNMLRGVQNYNQVKLEQPKTTPKPKTTTKSTNSSRVNSKAYKDAPRIAKALDVKTPGNLARALVNSEKEGKQRFEKEFSSLSKPEQNKITKILSNKANSAILDNFGEATLAVTDMGEKPKAPTETINTVDGFGGKKLRTNVKTTFENLFSGSNAYQEKLKNLNVPIEDREMAAPKKTPSIVDTLKPTSSTPLKNRKTFKANVAKILQGKQTLEAKRLALQKLGLSETAITNVLKKK